MRDAGRLFHLEDEVGIAQKELGDLEKSKNVADLGEAEKIVQLQKDKRKKRKIFEFSN